MLRIGRISRSAKMNEVTPPKLMPPLHSTTARGTLPIEHTKLSMATIGPISGPQIAESNGCPSRNSPCQNASGTHAPIAPAISRPATRSFQIAAHSITNTCATDVNPSAEVSRCQKLPWVLMDMSIAAWPSIDPATPISACSAASRMSRSRRTIRNISATSTMMIWPPMNSATVNCQPSNRNMMTPSSMTRLVEAISNAMAAVKLAPLRNNDRASATAAYEHDDNAIPNPMEATMARGRSSPISRTTVARRTTALATAERKNPKIRAHRISQVIDRPVTVRVRWRLYPLAPSRLPARFSFGQIHADYTPRGYQVDHRADVAADERGGDRHLFPGIVGVAREHLGGRSEPSDSVQLRQVAH